ncbi:unnamed protein product, partial [marine sediment metagenome]
MVKNEIIVILLFILFLIANVNVSATEWTTLNFGGKTDTTEAEQESSWTTLTFGGKADILAQVAPTQNSESPTNQTIGMSLNPTLQITLNDANGDTMNQSFWTNESGTWLAIGWNNNTGNGAVSNSTTVFDTYSTKYWWS